MLTAGDRGCRTIVSHGLGKACLANIGVSFEPLQGMDVCRILVRPSTRPVWVSGATGPEFYARFDNSTRQLLGSEILDYVADRWGDAAPRAVGAAAL